MKHHSSSSGMLRHGGLFLLVSCYHLLSLLCTGYQIVLDTDADVDGTMWATNCEYLPTPNPDICEMPPEDECIDDIGYWTTCVFLLPCNITFNLNQNGNYSGEAAALSLAILSYVGGFAARIEVMGSNDNGNSTFEISTIEEKETWEENVIDLSSFHWNEHSKIYVRPRKSTGLTHVDLIGRIAVEFGDPPTTTTQEEEPTTSEPTTTLGIEPTTATTEEESTTTSEPRTTMGIEPTTDTTEEEPTTTSETTETTVAIETTTTELVVPSSEEPSTTSKGNFLEIILLAVGICIGFVLVFGALLWKWLKDKEKMQLLLLSQSEYSMFKNGDPKVLQIAPKYEIGNYIAQLKRNTVNEIQEKDLIIKDRIGVGEFGIVFKGVLQQNGSTRDVVIKKNKEITSTCLKTLLRELKILEYIRQHGTHDNVIHLYGAVTKHIKERDVQIILEYCEFGSLQSYLRNNKKNYLSQVVNDRLDLSIKFNVRFEDPAHHYVSLEYEINTTNLITWCAHVAAGMEFLAQENIRLIHGDLATRNILLAGNDPKELTAKITDFGLSIYLKKQYNPPGDDVRSNDYVYNFKNELLPWRWLAPEIFEKQKFSSKSDVWAFAVTMWEIFTLGDEPYPKLTNNEDPYSKLMMPHEDLFDKLINDGYRMQKPKFAQTFIWNVIEQCWAEKPEDRPTFNGLRKYFELLLNEWDDPRGPPQLIHGNQIEYCHFSLNDRETCV